jgi:MFS family permease
MIDLPATRMTDTKGEDNTSATTSKEPWRDTRRKIQKGANQPMSEARSGPSASTSVTDALNEAPMGLFHLRAVLTSGMGFFTDAYDLFIIGTALVLIKPEWHLSSTQISLLSSTSLIAAFCGAFIFGRIADVFGRKKIYGLEAALMVLGAVLSSIAPDVAALIVFRFILGLGIGGDYPVSAVLMSEFANRKDRGKLVGLVFSMQALGLIVGPIVALTLLGAGLGHELAWRLMLGLGALPAAAVVYYRRRMPESPRYVERALGESERASKDVVRYSEGMVVANGAIGANGANGPASLGGSPEMALSSTEASSAQQNGVTKRYRMSFGQFLSDPRYMLYLLGTAGTWFILDYAFYGNTISTPLILKMVHPHASDITSSAISLMIFAIAAVPGYLLAVVGMDKIGHRRLQWIGFLGMGVAFLILAISPSLTTELAPFVVLYGVSYFFTEFGPNTTTFVIPAEVYPVSQRTTGHGLSAGIGKVGAFIGVYLFPILSSHFHLRGTLAITGVLALVGFGLTFVLPEPSRKTLEEVSDEEGELNKVRKRAVVAASIR